MAMYEPSMMKERSTMPVGSMPTAGHRQAATAAPSGAHMTAAPTTTHVTAAPTAHVTTASTMAVRHGKRRQ